MSYFSTGEFVNDKIEFVDSYTRKDNTLTYMNSRRMKRTKFVNKVNNWLDTYNYPKHFDFENTGELEKLLEENDTYLVKNKHVVENTMKKIYKLIQKKYKIKDDYQLKEDLCYFLYSVSSEP